LTGGVIELRCEARLMLRLALRRWGQSRPMATDIVVIALAGFESRPYRKSIILSYPVVHALRVRCAGAIEQL